MVQKLSCILRNQAIVKKIIFPIIVIAICLAIVPTLKAQDLTINIDANSHYYYRKDGASSIIVFVHGFLGDATSTWTNDSNESWQEFIKNDVNFKNYDIYNVNYNTAIFEESLNIPQIATMIKNDMEADDIFKYKKIHFIVHSLGGIVVKDMLTNMIPHEDKKLNLIKSISFLGVPSKGSSLADITQIYPRAFSNIYKDLVAEKFNTYLYSLNNNWKRLYDKKNRPSLNAWYETKKTNGLLIVSRDEASSFYDNFSPLIKNHLEIAKPKDKDDSLYKQVMNHIVESSDAYNIQKIYKIFSLPTTRIEDSKNTKQKKIITDQHIEFINYSNNVLYFDNINLTSGICLSLRDVPDDTDMTSIWMNDKETTKTLKINGKQVDSSHISMKLEPNEPLHIDIEIKRNILVSESEYIKIKNIPKDVFPLFREHELRKIFKDTLRSYILKLNSTTNNQECINLGKM